VEERDARQQAERSVLRCVRAAREPILAAGLQEHPEPCGRCGGSTWPFAGELKRLGDNPIVLEFAANGARIATPAAWFTPRLTSRSPAR
jgi:hypothetical protein